MLTVGFVGTVSDGSRYPRPPMPKWMFHDASVVVVRDGEVQFAVEEERCSRQKHTNLFPRSALRQALAHVGAGLEEIGAFAFPFSEDFVERELQLLQIGAVATQRPRARSEYARLIGDALGGEVEPSKLVFLDHHRCHAAAVWAKSGYEQTLIIVMDGSGERESISVFKASNQNLLRLATYSIAQSLGHFYSAAIQLLGFDLFDEYKVMGLAPFGKPEGLQEMFSKTYTLQADGQYELRADFQRFFLDAGFPVRSPGEPLLDIHRDFACGLQFSLERMASHLVDYWMTLTGSRNLCLSGGVAHNCAMTAGIARLAGVERLFVDPAAHDAGATLGAALLANDVPAKPLTHSFLGRDLPEDLHQRLGAWRDVVDITQVEDVVAAAAQLLAQGGILAWVMGRSEFGPRALGHRSILAAPGPASMRERVNALVKEREQFRPLAPVVTQQACQQFFEFPGSTAESPFMNTVGRVRAQVKELLGAVTHVDGTARVQTVTFESDASLHRLLCQFESLYGVPVLLNTSLNNRYEPIADSVEEALTCLVTMGLDAMVVGDFVVTVRSSPNLRSFFCSLPAGVILRHDLVGGPDGVSEAGPILEKSFDPGKSRSLSLELAQMLRANACVSLAGVGPAQLEEIKDLWRSRYMQVRPLPARSLEAADSR